MTLTLGEGEELRSEERIARRREGAAVSSARWAEL